MLACLCELMCIMWMHMPIEAGGHQIPWNYYYYRRL